MIEMPPGRWLLAALSVPSAHEKVMSTNAERPLVSTPEHDGRAGYQREAARDARHPSQCAIQCNKNNNRNRNREN